MDELHEPDYSPLIRSSVYTLQEQLCAQVKSMIIQGVFPPDSRLPSFRYLAQQFGVSRQTVKLAFDELAEAGLIITKPNRGAFVRSSDRKARTGLIGVVVHIASGPDAVGDTQLIYEQLLQQLDLQAHEKDMLILISYIDSNLAEDRLRLKELASRVDGILAIGLYESRMVRMLENLRVPVVSIMSNIELDSFDDIGNDNVKTYQSATRSLLESGCRNIAYLDGPGIYHQAGRRYAGCEKAVETFSEHQCRLWYLRADGWHSKDAKKSWKNFFLTHPSVDGVLAVNDIMAAGVLQAADEMELDVPSGLSVIGAKNTVLTSVTQPRLSSIECFFDEIALLAVARLLARIDEASSRPLHIEVTGELVARSSTR